MYESHDNIHSEIYYLDRHEAVKLKLFIVLLSLLLTMGVNEMCTCASGFRAIAIAIAANVPQH